jgi:hypothetical protein
MRAEAPRCGAEDSSSSWHACASSPASADASPVSTPALLRGEANSGEKMCLCGGSLRPMSCESPPLSSLIRISTLENMSDDSSVPRDKIRRKCSRSASESTSPGRMPVARRALSCSDVKSASRDFGRAIVLAAPTDVCGLKRSLDMDAAPALELRPRGVERRSAAKSARAERGAIGGLLPTVWLLDAPSPIGLPAPTGTSSLLAERDRGSRAAPYLPTAPSPSGCSQLAAE